MIPEELKTLKLTKQILVLPDQKYLIFLNSKCASSSIRKMAIYDLGYGPDLTYIKDLNLLKEYKDFTWIMVVRNPFSRLRSLWVDKVYRNLHKGFKRWGFSQGSTFESFVNRIIAIPDWPYVDSHLWPMFMMSEILENSKKSLIVRMEDWAGWPSDLPFPKIYNKSIQPESGMEELSHKAHALLRNKYYLDFGIYPNIFSRGR